MQINDTLVESQKVQLLKQLRSKLSMPINEHHEHLDSVLLASDFCITQLQRKGIGQLDNLDQPIDANWCHQKFELWHKSQSDDDHDVRLFLRSIRNHAMLRIIARMANGLTNCEQTISEISELAIGCVNFAVTFLYDRLSVKHGLPLDSLGNQQHLLVIAMGKLGGKELNLSSDIDLIFVYPEDGNTDDKDNSISNRIFFIKLGQQLIRLISSQNEEGFVFRVDMRLRPYGNSGSLVASFAELEKYYVEQARQWERFALARASVISGDSEAKEKLRQMIESYVYRQYIDFSVIDSLRTIKQDIRRMALRDDKSCDIKLGSGGIREIEFIAQTYQLVYGGKHYSLRSASTLQVLSNIGKEGFLDSSLVEQLNKSYLFLRSLENYIQASRDQQSHTLPSNPTEQYRLAVAMGYENWQRLKDNCDQHRHMVKNFFDDLILGGQQLYGTKDKVSQESYGYIQALFDTGQYDDSQFNTDAELRLSQLIKKINNSSELTQQLCRQLLPYLLDCAKRTNNADLALVRLCDLIEAIVRRPVYLNLLEENRSIILLISHTLVLSDWLYQQLCQYPALLESFIHVQGSTTNPTRSQYFDKLRSLLAGLAEDDQEQQILAMRHFTREAIFQVALGQLMNRLPLPKVSDALSYIAEACVDQALYLAWKYMTDRHGVPANSAGNEDPQSCGFAVIAYGKLGSLELNYTSDLDLVFVYSGKSTDSTDGDKPISLEQLYTRLAQRIIHLLTTPTSAGNGYQLDTRLRPQGSQGLLVTSIKGLEDYLHTQAWIWEHQALTRARPIAGDRNTLAYFHAIRKQVLMTERDKAKLSQEVWSMREKIDSIKQDSDIKYGAGGLVDIEFLVQHLLLLNAKDNPKIIEYSDNLRQLESLVQAGLLDRQQKKHLVDAYIELRSATHYLALGMKDHKVDIAKYTTSVQKIHSELGV